MPLRKPDPVLVNAQREAIVVMLLWAAAVAYTTGYCALYAYGRTLESLEYVWGFPDWIFYGLLVPWGACTIFTVVFCSFFMVDDDWGPANDADYPHETDQPTTTEGADRG